MKNTRAANKFKKKYTNLPILDFCCSDFVELIDWKHRLHFLKVFNSTETQIFTIATIEMKPISELFVFGALSVSLKGAQAWPNRVRIFFT
jgi:hypothetical protein